MTDIIGDIHSRVASLASAADALDATGSESAPEPEAASPAAGDSGADSAPADAAAPPAETAPAAPAEAAPDVANADADRKTRHDLLAEKLREVRERRQGEQYARRARELAEQAEADRKAAAEERAKYDGLRNGTFLETVKALGRDPREVFAEMRDEAVRAGTPEAQISTMQRQYGEQMAAALKEIESLKAEREAERHERETRAAQERFAGDFSARIDDPSYSDLRVEYSDNQLLHMASVLRDDPEKLFAHARALGVRLTHADGRYNMSDILAVLKRAHDEHETGRKQRRERFTASTQEQGTQQAAPATQATVNGTTDRRQSNPLGNATASSRASDAAPTRMTRAQRIQKLVERG